MHVRVHMGLAPVWSWGLITFQDTRESSFFKPLLRADPRAIPQPPVTSEYLRYVGQVQLVCSEPKNRPEGRRRYFACNDMRVTARQIMLGYRLRWAVEVFHKSVKQNLGFAEVSTSEFDSVISHVHWVYCAYILLHLSPPGVSSQSKSLGDKQRQLRTYLEAKEKRRILQRLTQIGGIQRFKDEIRQALGEV